MSYGCHHAVAVMAGGVPDFLEVHRGVGEAKRISLLKLAPWRGLRNTLRKWTCSGVLDDGGIRLADPVSVSSLLDAAGPYAKTAPVLYILESLYRAGWKISTAELPCEVNTTPYATVFSSTKLAQKQKSYFQALQCLPTLFCERTGSVCAHRSSGVLCLVAQE